MLRETFSNGAFDNGSLLEQHKMISWLEAKQKPTNKKIKEIFLSYHLQ
jgi:hypothetical protein